MMRVPYGFPRLKMGLKTRLLPNNGRGAEKIQIKEKIKGKTD